MERFSERESVLLGYNFQRPFINHPGSSPKSQYGNSDIDFTDVFGGPPRRSSLQEVRFSFSETTDSFASTSGDVDTKLSRHSLSALNDKPVFGDENVNRRRYPDDGFFGDIFRGSESLSSSPRKHDRDSLSSTPGSRVLSPAELLPHRVDPWSPSLPAQFSLPAKMIKGTDLPAFVSSVRGQHKNKDGASNGISNYTYSPLSRSASPTNLVRDELTNDVSRQSALSKEPSLSIEESSNVTKPEETDKSRNLKRDSDGSEIPTNRNQFHFSIYKWATKGLPFAMPLRGANKSRLNEKCKLQRCSSTNGWTACEGIARESRSATPHDIDIPSFSGRMELDKQDDHFLFDTSIQGEVEACQILEDTSFPISELDTPSNLQVIVEDGPINSALGASIETKHHSAPETGLFGKTKEEISVVTQEAHRTELKPLRSQLSENDYEQGIDEMTIKTGLKQSKVKNTKKSSAVPDFSENLKDEDETANSVGVDKANFQFPPTKSRDSFGKNRVRGKVKEFVKIFNQGVPEKPNFDLNDSQHQDSRRKEKSKFRIEDNTNEKMHSNNAYEKTMPNASILVDPDTTASNLKSTRVSSGRKDRSVPATDVPDVSESNIGDADLSFLLITELPQDEERGPQTSDNHEKIQIIDDKIQRWSKGKEGNIRSLLSTLQYVLWSGSGWKPVPLVDIIEGNAVKRTYQKALLCLHPDKLQQKGATSLEKDIAEKVFDILQEAWTHFNTLGAV
ncbi:J domain-containing protein required for chloroplast accumulation response 1-like isoform X2 [Populus alba x Populus x berolinensis]|uniref:J domain-containing protein required for chloroplast accumulation response 1-like isoform X2 n=1 Tax=Populus alba x Populus x berolinensis TaxID=444605 RepID=A0AAD6WC51_9ROSI|nr:J domain-containing protein required for chloroplast accumulation response 1-like isoform X2 [Populus alba x Populus x berolinensis]